jgi:hypothetical protein
VPFGGLVAVLTTGGTGGVTSIVNCSTASGDTPFIAVTVKVKEPIALGMPANTHCAGLLGIAFSAKPGGKVPAVTDTVIGSGLPVTVKVWVKG